VTLIDQSGMEIFIEFEDWSRVRSRFLVGNLMLDGSLNARTCSAIGAQKVIEMFLDTRFDGPGQTRHN
jgi:hypothetical protein